MERIGNLLNDQQRVRSLKLFSARHAQIEPGRLFLAILESFRHHGRGLSRAIYFGEIWILPSSKRAKSRRMTATWDSPVSHLISESCATGSASARRRQSRKLKSTGGASGTQNLSIQALPTECLTDVSA